MLQAQLLLIILFAFSAFMFLSTSKKRSVSKTIVMLFFLVVVMLITFRPSTMADYLNYKNTLIDSRYSRFEPGFLLVSALAGKSYVLGFFLIALISLSLKFFVAWKYKDYFWAIIMVYLSNVIVAQDMVAIRVGVAGSFLLLALLFKLKGELMKMTFAIFMAIMFHYTALVLLILFFMDIKKSRRIFYIALVFASYLMSINGIYPTDLMQYFSFMGDIMPLYDAYMLEALYADTTMNIFNLLQLGHLAVCLFMWFYIEKIQLKRKETLLLLKLYSIGICCVPWFAQSFSMAIRFSELFFVCEILLIPLGFSSIFNNRLYKIVMLLYAVTVFVIRITDMTYWNPVN